MPLVTQRWIKTLNLGGHKSVPLFSANEINLLHGKTEEIKYMNAWPFRASVASYYGSWWGVIHLFWLMFSWSSICVGGLYEVHLTGWGADVPPICDFSTLMWLTSCLTHWVLWVMERWGLETWTKIHWTLQMFLFFVSHSISHMKKKLTTWQKLFFFFFKFAWKCSLVETKEELWKIFPTSSQVINTGKKTCLIRLRKWIAKKKEKLHLSKKVSLLAALAVKGQKSEINCLTSSAMWTRWERGEMYGRNIHIQGYYA